jgi:hypothetical protein
MEHLELGNLVLLLPPLALLQ